MQSMAIHTDSMWRNRFFFTLLYFIQGAVLAYIVNFQKPFLTHEGVSKQALGLFTSLLLLPFIFKVFLGMLSDRVPLGSGGSRKPYMLIGLALFAACYFSLAWISPRESFPFFACVTWLASLGLALFDTCADGWAIDISGESEQSGIQASMIAGKSVGFIIMSLGFGWLAEREGFRYVFLLISGLALAVLVKVIFTAYQPKHIQKSGLDFSWGDLRKPFYLLFAAFGVLYSVSSFGTDGLVSLFLSEVRHAGNVAVGTYGVGRGVGALLGAVGYAWVSKRVGLRGSQFLALAILGFGCLSPLLAMPLVVSGALWGMCWGFQETAYVTLAMRFAQGQWAATFFAISMIFSNLGTSVGEALGAPLVPSLGYRGIFICFAILAWCCAALVPGMTQGASPAKK